MLKEKNASLSQELESSQTQLHTATAELAETKSVLRKEKRKDGEDQQSEEVESLKAQLLAAQKENERLKHGMFSMSLFETII